MPGEAPPTPARAHQPLFSCISTTAARECACEDLVGKKRLLIYKKKYSGWQGMWSVPNIMFTEGVTFYRLLLFSKPI